VADNAIKKNSFHLSMPTVPLYQQQNTRLEELKSDLERETKRQTDVRG
jgi:hypothetical protein